VNKTILIIDDEKHLRWAMKKALEKQSYNILEAGDGTEGIKIFKESNPDLVLLDLKMPGIDGMETLIELKKINNQIPMIMITAHGTMESAVEAMKKGALDYISKPFDIEELKVVIEKALNIGSLTQQIRYLKEEIQNTMGKPIIGNSAGLKDVLSIVQRVANTNATILINGESGTGKELIANIIHYNSNRKEGPYVKVNCGAIPESLIESELFGYEKGAFTGAAVRKIGKFERADKGTIFLDEIGELDLSMQVKLLRVLQEREIERIGGNQTISIDIRVVAATNRDLLKMVSEGNFREDLYYRLNVIPIKLPPLRERQGDIILLAEYFVEKYSREFGRANMIIDEEVKDYLWNYSWKGNIRELENVIERMILLSESNIITKSILPREILKKEETQTNTIEISKFILPEEGLSIEELEKELIVQALERSDYNQTKAAKLLGITRHTLIYRMEKYNIEKN
jgi:two-component system, NtrC family, response regulator AtoC